MAMKLKDKLIWSGRIIIGIAVAFFIANGLLENPRVDDPLLAAGAGIFAGIMCVLLMKYASE